MKLGVQNLVYTDENSRHPVSSTSMSLNRYTVTSIRDEISGALSDDFRENPESHLVVCDDKYFDPYIPENSLTDISTALKRREYYSNIFSRVVHADVVIITLGQIEGWLDTYTGNFFSYPIPNEVLEHHPQRFVVKVLGYDECRDAFTDIIRLINSDGPEKKILVTTSPVPATRTMRPEDAICAYVHTKSLLRTLAQEFTDNHSSIDYFPSYEMVTQSPRDLVFGDDLIHVKDSVVSTIMSKFLSSYITPPASGPFSSKFALLEASNLRSNGQLEEACERLQPILNSNQYDSDIVIEFALVTSRLGRIDDAAKALAGIDAPVEIETPDYNTMLTAMNAAVTAINEERNEEAAARILVTFAMYRGYILDINDDRPLTAFLETLRKICDLWILNILPGSEVNTLLGSAYSRDADIACRKAMNEALAADQHAPTAELKMAIEQVWKNFRGVLIAPSSGDIRKMLTPMLKSAGMDAPSVMLEIVDEILEIVETNQN